MIVLAVVFITCGFAAGYALGARLWISVRNGISATLREEGVTSGEITLRSEGVRFVWRLLGKGHVEVNLKADDMDAICERWIARRKAAK